MCPNFDSTPVCLAAPRRSPLIPFLQELGVLFCFVLCREAGARNYGVAPISCIQDVHDFFILHGTFLVSKENMEVSGLGVSPVWGREAAFEVPSQAGHPLPWWLRSARGKVRLSQRLAEWRRECPARLWKVLESVRCGSTWVLLHVGVKASGLGDQAGPRRESGNAQL